MKKVDLEESLENWAGGSRGTGEIMIIGQMAKFMNLFRDIPR